MPPEHRLPGVHRRLLPECDSHLSTASHRIAVAADFTSAATMARRPVPRADCRRAIATGGESSTSRPNEEVVKTLMELESA
jgi:hypothetical protein